jgi:hypothetical protein
MRCEFRVVGRFLPVTLAVIIMTNLSGGIARAGDAAAWLIGKPLAEQLAAQVGVAFAGSPLRTSLGQLARAQRVAILLDRRVDPGREVNLTVDATPLKNVIAEVAQRLGLEVCQYQSVVYLGPPGSVARLKAITARRRDEARRLPAAAARRFFREHPLRWDDFATPREVLAELGRSGSVRIEGEDRVPHDLLAAADLPAMTLVDRLTLALFQFDLSFEITGDGKGIKVVPMPEDIAALGAEPNAQPPGRSDATPASDSSEPIDLTKVRVERMAVENQPLGGVLGQLAKRWKLELRIDEPSLRRAGKSLDRRVSLRVENVTVPELFEALLKPEGLTFRLDGRILVISAVE